MNWQGQNNWSDQTETAMMSNMEQFNEGVVNHLPDIDFNNFNIPNFMQPTATENGFGAEPAGNSDPASTQEIKRYVFQHQRISLSTKIKLRASLLQNILNRIEQIDRAVAVSNNRTDMITDTLTKHGDVFNRMWDDLRKIRLGMGIFTRMLVQSGPGEASPNPATDMVSNKGSN